MEFKMVTMQRALEIANQKVITLSSGYKKLSVDMKNAKTELRESELKHSGLKKEKDSLQGAPLEDERGARSAMDKKASDDRTALLGVTSRVEGGVKALHAHFSYAYAQGYRDGFTDCSLPKG
ncbi:uncharacterized protein LOC132300542 [Cornus florida]|uniref:uncharacterized protein LOC132300542 n=1 Tax=Cornus florida TaxID=4283 RepID=UPI00289A5001|nr:uncharacterized protein LOC132300542 [Cornus florida]